MATPDVLDFSRLLAPISEESPTGVSLRDDDTARAHFDAVLEARKAAKEAEKLLYRQEVAGEEEGAPALGNPDWKKVINASQEVLAEHSKDLWITAWLIEGLVREHAYAGLRDGFRLVKELCSQYWDDIHPRPYEDNPTDVGHTLAQIGGLDESLKATIHNAIEITHSEKGNFTNRDYIAAFELEQDTGVSRVDFDTAASSTSDAFFRELYEDLRQCRDEFDGMRAVLEEKCGQDEKGFSRAPGFTNLGEVLDSCEHRLRVIAGQALMDEGEEEQGAMVPQSGTADAITDGAVANRENAFKLLTEVAKFFERTEPHSPVSFALRQVVRWGRMSLPDLLSELITDESVRKDLARRVGLPMESSNDEEG